MSTYNLLNSTVILVYFNNLCTIMYLRKENNEIKQDSSSSIPYMFVVEHTNDKYKVTDSRIPRDGVYYAEDMKNIFPRSVRKDMDEIHNDGTIKKLKMDIEKQLNLYL